MGLLHPAPGASDTVWLPWKPPRKGKSNLMPVTTWRLLIHLLAAPGENSQGRTHVGIPPGPQGPFPELAGLPLASINPWKNSIIPGGTDSHILTPAGELWVEGVTDGRLQPSGLPGTHYVRKLVTAF